MSCNCNNENPLDPCSGRCRCENPCGDNGPTNSAACESLPSQIDNFTLQFFGEVIKTEVNGKVVWSLPCTLDTGLPANPRGETEPLGCYILRLFEDGILGSPGEQGEPGANGSNGTSAYTTVSAAFVTPSLESPYVQISTRYNVNVVAGANVFIADSGWYSVTGTDGTGVLFANLIKLVEDPIDIVPVGSPVIPAGQTGAGLTGDKGPQGIQGLQGVQGVQGPPGTPAPNVTNNNGFFFTATGTDFTITGDTYAAVTFGGGAFDPTFTLPDTGTFLVVAKSAVNTGADVYLKLYNNNTAADVSGTEQRVSPSAANEFRHCTMTSIFTGTVGDVIQLYAKGSVGYMDGGLAGANSQVYASVLQADGKLIIVGSFTAVNGVSRKRIARLNTDGSLDTGFLPTLNQGPNNTVHCVAILADQRIVIGGEFTSFTKADGVTNVPMSRLLLLDANGSIDTADSWANPAVNSTVYAVVAQADNNIVLGGSFTSVNATSRRRLARVNTSGTLDGTYGTTTNGPSDTVVSILLIQTAPNTGSCMIGGNFTTVNGLAHHRLARVDTSGLADPAFVDPVLNSTVWALCEDTVTTPGLIFAGGNFTLANATARQRIACFTDLGALDTFAAATEFVGGTVQAIKMDTAGDLIVGGLFTSYNSTVQHYASKLQGSGGSRGQLDASWGDVNVGAGGVYTVSIQTDGKILIAGNFVAVQSTPRGRVARLNADGSLNTVAVGVQSVPYLYTDISWIQIA